MSLLKAIGLSSLGSGRKPDHLRHEQRRVPPHKVTWQREISIFPRATLLPKTTKEIEDLRRYRPGPEKYMLRYGVPAKFGFDVMDRLFRPPDRLMTVFRDKSKKRQMKRQIYTRLAFRSPDSTLVCLRRQARREVIHALVRRMPGAGSGRTARKAFRWLANQPRHYNSTSMIECVRKGR